MKVVMKVVMKDVMKDVMKYVMVVMSTFSFEPSFSQTTFYIASSEYHWTNRSVVPVIKQGMIKDLSENHFRLSADSNNADFIIRIKCNSYYNGQTPYFYFALLDANLSVTDKKNGKLIYANDLRRIKGGGTTVELADDKVYANATRIIADTLISRIYYYMNGKALTLSSKPGEFEVLCDADKDIPSNSHERKNTYVLIIVNDSYSPMQMARCFSDSADYHSRDARVFREYAIQTLGIPAENVRMIFNTKSFEMRREIIRLASYSRGIDGNADLILYYAGYGLIDEKTLDPYILPTDVENDDPKFIVRVSDLYKMLQEDASRRITIILEASFRFDVLKPAQGKSKISKITLRYPNVPANVFLMAAATPGTQAWSDPGAGHGLFTLSLLKKLKESQGKASLKELSDFIIKDVRATSVRMSFKEQVPHALSGSFISKDLNLLKL
ncbi:MAG: caspase family protein [Bacteroidota bacterium]